MRHAGACNLWLDGACHFEANTGKNNRKDNFEIGLFYYNLKKRPGVSSCPPGCKISPYNSKVCIEQNLAISKNVALVEACKT